MDLLVGLIGLLVMALVHVVVIALDIVLFFVLARFLSDGWKLALFERFNAAGSPLIEPLFILLQKIGFASRAQFLVLSVALTICRLCLVIFARSFV